MNLTNAHPRRHRIRRIAGPTMAALALLLVAACGSGNGGSSSGSSQTSGQSAGTVAARSTSDGTILTNGSGMTLYAFAADQKGMSNCEGSCLTYWPPVIVSSTPKAAAGVSAQLGTIISNGHKQLTVNGWPMYTHVGDHSPGDTSGQGLNESGGLWWVVSTNGSWITGSGGSSGNPSSSSPSSPYTRLGY
jgi:predicted lipoprotein with Yx(FWY)xxD motif